jgi:hypothetical protein
VTCWVGGHQLFFVTLNLVNDPLSFHFANTYIQQSTIDTPARPNPQHRRATFVLTHGGHVTCSRTGHTLGVHPRVSAEMLCEVVLPGELLVVSVALGRSPHRVWSSVPRGVPYACTFFRTRTTGKRRSLYERHRRMQSWGFRGGSVVHVGSLTGKSCKLIMEELGGDAGMHRVRMG